jgi:chemotaxis protein methyltransferase CheR
MTLPELEVTPPPAGALDQVTDAELKRFADLIYARTGIRVSPQKRMLLSNRLRRRLRVTGIQDFSRYYDHLHRLRPNDPEWDAFLQEITTHESYLFRDENQWRWFRGEFMAECDARARAQGPRPVLRIWSAACSTGDEATTAACCLAACLPNLAQWEIRILGTDIGLGALEQANSGVFGERAMRLVPEEYRRRFFHKTAAAPVWQANPALMRMLAFRQHNLMERLNEKPFDLVLLKNVLIYFDTASKKTVVAHVCANVRPGGLLVAGAAEGIADMLSGFQRIHPWLYRKPLR